MPYRGCPHRAVAHAADMILLRVEVATLDCCNNRPQVQTSEVSCFDFVVTEV